MAKILITGGTGVVGSHVLDHLDGQDVRVLAHSDASAEKLRNHDVVRGDLGDPATLEAVFEGVDRLFLLTPYSPGQGEQELAAVTAARAAGVSRIVKLSSLLAGRGLEIMRFHEEVEGELAGVDDVDVVVLKPDNFMQNELRGLELLAQGLIVNPTGDALIGFIDARDIGAAGAAALTAEQAPVGDQILTGPERLTYAQFAARVGAVLGRDVQHVSPSDEDFIAGAIGAGVPDWYARDLSAMLASFRERGASADAVSDGVERLTGRAPRTVEHFTAEVLAPALGARV